MDGLDGSQTWPGAPRHAQGEGFRTGAGTEALRAGGAKGRGSTGDVLRSAELVCSGESLGSEALAGVWRSPSTIPRGPLPPSQKVIGPSWRLHKSVPITVPQKAAVDP